MKITARDHHAVMITRMQAGNLERPGASLVTIPASPVPALTAVPVPPGQHASSAAETQPDVAPRDTLAGQAMADRGEDLIIGIAGAAGYLGYDQPDSFRRAHTRHPIVGETRTPDGRPAWTSAALRAWRARHLIAGSHATGHDPD